MTSRGHAGNPGIAQKSRISAALLPARRSLPADVGIKDLTGGYTAYRRSVLEAIPLDEVHSDGYSFQIEMKYRAHKLGFKHTEIPITFTDRKAGASKISRRIVVEALILVWFLKFTIK